jgi:tetratricopeptide (TPR) repeat protein/WD40 repeat protein
MVGVTFSPRGDLLASVAGESTHLWDARTARELLTASGLAGDFSRDGRWLGLGVLGTDVGRWEVAADDEFRLLAGHSREAAIEALDLSPDGRWLASAAADGVHLWDAAAGKVVANLPTGPAHLVLFDRSGRFFLTGGPSGLFRWPIRTEAGTPSARLQLGPPQAVHLPRGCQAQAASLSEDGRTLAVKTSWGSAAILRLDRPDEEPRWINHPVLMLAISPDAEWLATTTENAYEAKLWDARTGKWIRDFPGVRTARVAFSPDNRWLVFATAQEYYFHRVGSWQPGRRVGRDYAGYVPGFLAFTRDGRMAALTHTPRLIRLLDPAGDELATLAAPVPEALTSLSITPDGTRLAAGTAKGLIQYWDLRHIRERLREMRLDWEPRAAPPEPDGDPQPSQVEVDPGDLLDRESYSFILTFFPLHSEAYYSRGLAYARFGQGSQAFADFSQVIVLQPDHAEAYYQRGLLHAQEGKLPQASADFSRTIVLHPKHGDAYQQRGHVYARLQQLDKAVADYTQALPLQRNSWELRYRLGLLHWQLRQWPRAVAVFARGLEVNATAQPLWAYRGVNYLELGQWQKALADFTRALELDDTDGWVWNCRGIAHAVLNQWDKAEADFARAVRRDPTSTDLWHQHALTRLALGDRDGYRRVCMDALRHFEKPADSSSALALAWTCVLAPDAVGHPARPVQLAERAVTGASPSYAAVRTLGAALLRAGKFEEAIRELNRAADMRPESLGTWLLLALAHHRLGHADEGRPWLEKAVLRIEKLSRQKPTDSDGLPEWDRIPLRERVTIQILLREAEPLLGERAMKRITSRLSPLLIR